MGIDGIGKPGPGLPPLALGGVGPATGPASAEPFRVEAGAPAEPAGRSEPLDRLGRGELSLGEYLEARVVEATAHLEGRLTTEQLEFVKSSLRQQLETDPVLVELVRRATGSLPAEPAR